MEDTRKPRDNQRIPTARPLAHPLPFARPIAAARRVEGFLLETQRRSSAWIDVAALIACLVLLDLLMQTGLGIAAGVPLDLEQVDPEQLDPQLQRALFVPLILLRAVGWLAVTVAVVRARRQSLCSLGFVRRGWALNLLIGGASALAVYGLMLLTQPLIWLLWPDLWEQMAENAGRIMELVPRLHPLAFAAVAAMVGLYEEVIFRGFLMTRLRRATGSWIVAVLASTALFTVVHALDQTVAALIWITVLSLVFSVVTIWRCSIIPAVVGHSLFDLSQFLLLYIEAGDSWA